MSRTEHGTRTRVEILQAAARLFAQQGYFHTSTTEILQSASISKGAFYYHFSSKEQLARDVLDQLRRDYQDRLVGPVWSGGQAGQRFGRAAGIVIELNDSGEWTHCALLARLSSEMAFARDPLAELIGQTLVWIVQFWNEVIADDQANGAIDPKLDSERLAETLVSAIFGAMANRELLGRRDHLEQVFDQFAKMMIFAAKD
jgi:TetR/AcrR family transcriptional regulator, transcriptional repressor for nem operon